MSARLRSVALVPVIALVAACSGSDAAPVEASPAAAATSSACTKASTHWPTEVSGLAAYPVSTPSKAVRAWGKDADHAVIARCGVSSPGPTTDACFSADGVDWVQMPLADGNRFVTYGREPAIEVLVPKDSGLDGTALAAFTPAASTIAQGPHRCS